MEEWLLHFVGLNKFVEMAARESPPPCQHGGGPERVSTPSPPAHVVGAPEHQVDKRVQQL